MKSAGICLSLLLFLSGSFSLAADGAGWQKKLEEADKIRSSNPRKMAEMLAAIEASRNELSSAQIQYLNYLLGYRAAFTGEYQKSISILKGVVDESEDLTMMLRAYLAMVNVHSLDQNFSRALENFAHVQKILPEVKDKKLVILTYVVGAILYNHIEHYQTGLRLAEKALALDASHLTRCKAGYLQVQAQVHLNLLKNLDYSQEVITSCEKANEPLLRQLVVGFEAKWLSLAKNYQGVLDKLLPIEKSVESLSYPRLSIEYYFLLADAYWHLGMNDIAALYAKKSVDSVGGISSSKAVANAYHLLHRHALEDDRLADALKYLEKFSVADKAYLNDVTARQVAYQLANQMSGAATGTLLESEGAGSKNGEVEPDQESQSGWMFAWLSSGVAVLAFVGVLLYLRSRRRSFNSSDSDIPFYSINDFFHQTRDLVQMRRAIAQPCVLILLEIVHWHRCRDEFGWLFASSLTERLKQTLLKSSITGSCATQLSENTFAILKVNARKKDTDALLADLKLSWRSADSSGTGLSVHALQVIFLELDDFYMDLERAILSVQESARLPIDQPQLHTI